MPLYHESVETPAHYANIPLFVAAHLVEVAHERVMMRDIYAAYLAWCAGVEAAEVHTMTAVGRMLTAYGVRKTNCGGMWRIGIALRDDPVALSDDSLRPIRRKSAAEFIEQQRLEKIAAREAAPTVEQMRQALDQEHARLKHKDVAEWAQVDLVCTPGAETPVEHVYSRYADWCEAKELDRFPLEDLAYSLKKAGIEVDRLGIRAKIKGFDMVTES